MNVKSALRVFLRSILPIVAGIAALIVVIAWLAGAFESKIAPELKTAEERRVGEQPTAAVRRVTRRSIEQAVGTLKAARRTQISSKVLATIDEITVRAGDFVERGDVLVRLDSKELQARVKEAEEAVKAARASLNAAETDFQRAQELYEGEAIPKSKYDDAETQFEVAQAEFARARQKLSQVQIVESYAVIKAPKDGRIVDRLAQPGDTARPGNPLLVLYDAASLRLEVPVVEPLALQLKVGEKLPVSIDALDREFKARIDEIVPQADAPSRSFLVKAALPRREDLYEGMFGRLQIPAGTREYLCVPEAAVRRIGQLEFVEVVHEDETLERRYVKTGQPCPPHGIEVLSGLEAGERVALKGKPDNGGPSP